jgi:hypothetical protein
MRQRLVNYASSAVQVAIRQEWDMSDADSTYLGTAALHLPLAKDISDNSRESFSNLGNSIRGLARMLVGSMSEWIFVCLSSQFLICVMLFSFGSLEVRCYALPVMLGML